MIDPKSSIQLRTAFEAEDGFLVRLRAELIWDKESFQTLVDAMQQYLEKTGPAEQIERLVAEVFWFTETFTNDWISHPNFPKPHAPRYYEKALERLHGLSYWLFIGESPAQSGTLEPFDA
jgi:hypothetical protein